MAPCARIGARAGGGSASVFMSVPSLVPHRAEVQVRAVQRHLAQTVGPVLEEHLVDAVHFGPPERPITMQTE